MKWNVLEFSLMMGYNPKIPPIYGVSLCMSAPILREDSICGRIFAHFYSGQPWFFFPVADVDHSALDDAFKLISIKKCQGIFWVPSRASPT
jgi:hypothetical protein